MALLSAAKHFFKRRPLVANCCIYGSLYVGAELSQQTIMKKVLSDPPQDIDKPTLARYAVIGTLCYSPILFYWYKWLDRAFPGTTKKMILRKLVLDQFFLSPLLLAIFFTGMALMEMQKRPFEEMQNKFVPTFMRSCMFWLPTQTVNFYLVPPQFRVVFMGLASFVWCNILCYVKRQKLSYEKSN